MVSDEHATGIELIAMERDRQKTAEGYTVEHDLDHQDDTLAMAAAVYAVPRSGAVESPHDGAVV